MNRASAVFPQICLAFKLPEPKPEHRFHKKRMWRIDWFFEADGVKVGLEVEGGVFTGGRHTRGKGFAGDIEKYNAMAAQRIFLIRVMPKDLMRTATLELIRTVLYGT